MYGGLLTTAGGVIMWFSAPTRSERGMQGKYMIISGFAMIIFYFGSSIFINFLQVVIWESLGF